MAHRVPETDPDHPRPFLQREWTSLDGRWSFSPDPDTRWEDPLAPPFDAEILVPFAPETPASGVGAKGWVQQCWYRRALGVPAAAEGERIRLWFNGVDRIADVWVDGHHVGHHVGGYAPFCIDITETAHPAALLVVRARDDAHDLEVPRGKQDWQETSHAIWYPRTTGIWKTVWVERVSRTALADLGWRSDPRAMTLTLEAVVEGPIDDGLRLDVRLACGERLLVEDSIAVTGSSVTRNFGVGDGGFDDRLGLLWWPGRPTLIDAELTLRRADRAVDRVLSYTALREVEVRDGEFRVNGRPYPLRLVLDQGYWPETGATPPDVAALRLDIELTRALGFNGARKHQKVEDPRYFALADRMGLLVWVEMPSAYRPGTRAADALLREWSDVIAAHRNHPSVVAWVPINESWGVSDCVRDAPQRALIAAMRELAYALDGSRPVSANDGWETSGGDLVGIHDYDQDPAVLASRYGTPEAIDALLRGVRHDGKSADLDCAAQAGRAVVLSEFGGTALAADTGEHARFGTANWGYDRVASADELLRRYRALWSAVHESSGLVGACWTQLTDTYQEVNGLLRADRSPKIDPELLRAATRGRRERR